MCSTEYVFKLPLSYFRKLFDKQKNVEQQSTIKLFELATSP